MARMQSDKARLPQAFWGAVDRTGLPPAALLRQARLPATLHLQGDVWLDTAQYFALWRAAEVLSGDPAIGLRMTVATDTSLHPPATMSAFFARDYRDGLERLARFKRLCTPEGLALTETPQAFTATVSWPFATGQEPDAATDVTLAAMIELGRRGTGAPIRPQRVELTRAGPVPVALRDYFDAPILCGKARNALILDAADLDRPFAGHNPDLLAILTPALAASLDEIGAQDSVVDQVRAVLARRLASGKPDLAAIAQDLGTSERTLQRRITESGTSFRKLLEEARHDLGRQMLGDPQNGVDEIAFLLGFQDTSSFYRAFRAWEGVTPAEWRRLH